MSYNRLLALIKLYRKETLLIVKSHFHSLPEQPIEVFCKLIVLHLPGSLNIRLVALELNNFN